MMEQEDFFLVLLQVLLEMETYFRSIFSTENKEEITEKIFFPGNVAFIRSQILIKIRSGKQGDNEFEEIAPIFRTNTSLGPKLSYKKLKKICTCKYHVYFNSTLTFCPAHDLRP